MIKPLQLVAAAVDNKAMKRRFWSVIDWKDRLLVDVVASVIEACLVLLISSLYLIVLAMKHGLDTEGIGLREAFGATVDSALRPTEIIVYVTGVLSSTTAYFAVRVVWLKAHIKIILGIFAATAILFWVATPLFMSGLQSPPANETLAIDVAVGIGICAVALWLISLFSQRRIFDRGDIPISGDRRGREIASNVGSANA